MNIDASFSGIRANLSYILSKKEDYKREFISTNENLGGGFLVKISTECMLLLDQFMEIVWTKFANLEKKKPYVTFPVVDNLDKFNELMRKRNQLPMLEEDCPELFNLIKSVQPFNCGESWLFFQYHIASERHSEPRFVYTFRSKDAINMTAPSLIGQDFSISIGEEGNRKTLHFRNYGVPYREPPRAVIKSKEEALSFIENCITGTNSLVGNMIACFEKNL